MVVEMHMRKLSNKLSKSMAMIQGTLSRIGNSNNSSNSHSKVMPHLSKVTGSNKVARTKAGISRMSSTDALSKASTG